ncbi:hypothetical protein [Natronobacterium gregoryi]|uniref:Uncharacterized protein n=2 Tax=Natronobacterium gregoryi TaxID=44930 RepID=L0AI85_NATGS|nr:hypothetical protein [Natronobacterium gregoryi]AFZ73139.1 hypothetical protein Natgr_1956 [Natronobacterium gregoryi SP2]ELY70766.1 hypothetical protein C490_05722 [Natronobacterium gregoryi SP2]PLK21550.1 hypothetical protein CYV19_03035 [Natronobacterium gregoryi SP2]SFI60389.1 hypothetical protein SAMN05443661_102126 [Natronobacterium gregoryi]
MAVTVSFVDDADATVPSAVEFFDADSDSYLDEKTAWAGDAAVSAITSGGCVDSVFPLPAYGS